MLAFRGGDQMRKIFVLCITLLMIQTVSAKPKKIKGVTEPYKSTFISSTVAGRLAHINYPEGEVVKKGYAVLYLDKAEEELEVARRKLIAENTVELQSAEFQVKTLEKDYQATKMLFDSSRSVSEEELWIKELEYKKALSEIERLKMLEEKEKLELKIAQAQLYKRKIIAPFTGKVVKINRKVGESTNALEPLVHLVDVKKCRFVTYIAANKSHDLAKGMKVNLEINGFSPRLKKEGTIEFISPVADPSSGLRELRIVFDNHDKKVKPGVNGYLVLGP